MMEFTENDIKIIQIALNKMTITGLEARTIVNLQDKLDTLQLNLQPKSPTPKETKVSTK